MKEMLFFRMRYDGESLFFEEEDLKDKVEKEKQRLI